MKLAIIIAICFLSSCGLTEYEHIELAPGQDDSGQNIDESCRLLDIAYQSEIKPIVESRCQNCHFPGAGIFPFIAGNDAANTEIFANLLEGDGQAIIAKTTNQIPHGGGEQLQEGEEKNVETFFDALRVCSES